MLGSGHGRFSFGVFTIHLGGVVFFGGRHHLGGPRGGAGRGEEFQCFKKGFLLQ